MLLVQYAFEWDLKGLDLTKTDVDSHNFSIESNKLYINLKIEGGANYDCHLHALDGKFPGTVRFRLELVKKMHTITSQPTFNVISSYQSKSGDENGVKDWIDQATIRDHVIRVKVWIVKAFSDFVKKPLDFESFRSLLLDELSSNLSYKVGDEVVYAIHRILSTRSEYFRDIIANTRGAHGPTTVLSKIPICGVDVDVFEMIIEWIYTMDIQRLERVYLVAENYLLTYLCSSIVKYLCYLLNDQTFGEIYQIAQRIGCDSLIRIVYRSWISKSDVFNKNKKQINILIFDQSRLSVEETDSADEEMMMVASKDQETLFEEMEEFATLYHTSQEIVRASDWGGDCDDKMNVIKCLTSLLSIDKESRKRKLE
jgi:hypothetical protein